MGVVLEMEGDKATNEIDDFYSSIGFDLAEKESDLGLLVSAEERKYYRFLIRTIPNVSNIDVIPLTNLACLLATFKKLNGFISKIEDNIELYLKLISKRNETVSKIDMVLKSYGLTGTTRDKLIIPYEIEETEGE